MMKSKFLSLLIVILIVASFCPIALADGNQMYEIVDHRTSNMKVFQKSDGSYLYRTYATDVHYKDERNVYQEIDETIHESNKTEKEQGYVLKNGANDWEVLFSDKTVSKDIIKILKSNYEISFNYINSGNNLKVCKLEDLMSSPNMLLKDSFGLQNTVIYQDISKNVDLLYVSGANDLKENIILKNREVDFDNISFSIKLKKLSMIQKDGMVMFVNDDGDLVYKLGSLSMEDSSGKYSTNLRYDIKSSGDNEYVLHILVDKDFLNNVNTIYPVIIDPTISVTGTALTFDSFVACMNPTSSGTGCGTCGMCTRNFNRDTNLNYLRTGKDTSYGVRRTFIKFDYKGIPAGVNFTSVTLKLTKSSGSSTAIYAHRVYSSESWDSNTITWMNKPTIYTSTYVSPAATISGSTYSMDVKSIVERSIYDGYDNTGFCIKDSNESNTNVWATFYSSDNSTNKPVLEFVVPADENVTLKVAGDGLFRTYNSGWTYVAQDVLELVDDFLYRTALIDFTTKSYYTTWSSPSDICPNTSQHNHLLTCECGGDYDHDYVPYIVDDLYLDVPISTYNLRYGFVGAYYLWSLNGQAGGCTRCQYPPLLSDNSSVVSKVSWYYNTEDGIPLPSNYQLTWITAHETGHLYGCADHTDGRNCIMDSNFLYWNSGDVSLDNAVFCNECLERFRTYRLLH